MFLSKSNTVLIHIISFLMEVAFLNWIKSFLMERILVLNNIGIYCFPFRMQAFLNNSKAVILNKNGFYSLNMSFLKVMLVFFIKRKALQIINFFKTSQHFLKNSHIFSKKTNAFLAEVIVFCFGKKQCFLLKWKLRLLTIKFFLWKWLLFFNNIT